MLTKIVNYIRAGALNHRQAVALLEEHKAKHSDISYRIAIRWLSLGKGQKRVWDLKGESVLWKERTVQSSQTQNIRQILNLLLTCLHEWTKYSTVRQGPVYTYNVQPDEGFHKKVSSESDILTDMPTVKEAITSAYRFRWYSCMLGVLHDEFSRQSEDFKTVTSELSSAALLIMHPVNSVACSLIRC